MRKKEACGVAYWSRGSHESRAAPVSDVGPAAGGGWEEQRAMVMRVNTKTVRRKERGQLALSTRVL